MRFLILLPIFSFAIAAEINLSLLDIKKSIEKNGAHETLQLVGNDGHDQQKWEKFRKNIAGGNKEWIDVGLTLYEVSDASVSEEIMLSLGEALGNNPENVFARFYNGQNSRATLENLCDGPDVDDERFNSIKLSFAEIQKRISKISSVKDKQYKEIKDKCIKSLTNSKKHIENFFEK